MMTANESKMPDFNIKEIVEGVLDSAIGLLTGGVIGALITLLTRVPKKEHVALAKRVDDNHTTVMNRIAEIERAHKDVATQADLRELKTELKSDFRESIELVNANLNALREDLRLSRAHQ